MSTYVIYTGTFTKQDGTMFPNHNLKTQQEQP